MVAFLGRNGAGKSTSVRMLTTLLPPTAGEAERRWLRRAARARARCAAISAMSARAPAPAAITEVRDELVTQGLAQQMSKADSRRRADELIGMLELTGLEQRTAQTLSSGQKRRLDVALGADAQPEGAVPR